MVNPYGGKQTRRFKMDATQFTEGRTEVEILPPGEDERGATVIFRFGKEEFWIFFRSTGQAVTFSKDLDRALRKHVASLAGRNK